MDAWALRSHQRAVAAIDAGQFADEIFPVDVVNRPGGSGSSRSMSTRGATRDGEAGIAQALHPESKD